MTFVKHLISFLMPDLLCFARRFVSKAMFGKTFLGCEAKTLPTSLQECQANKPITNQDFVRVAGLTNRRFVSKAMVPLTSDISKFSVEVLKKNVRGVSNTSVRYQKCQKQIYFQIPIKDVKSQKVASFCKYKKRSLIKFSNKKLRSLTFSFNITKDLAPYVYSINVLLLWVTSLTSGHP